MAKVQRTASKIAWSIKTQSAFGTPLVKTDMTKFLKLADPAIIDDNAEHWSDRGMISLGHEWETQRGVNRYIVKVEIPVQPLPIEFVAFLVGLFCSKSTAVDNTGSYTHTSILDSIATIPAALVTTLAIYEDGVSQCVQDVCCTSLTIRGDGPNRMEVGATLIGSKLGTAFSDYTWPTVAAANYVNSFAGLYTRGGADKKTELRSFELTMANGISLDLAYQKAATEALRPYPAIWRYTPDRSVGLKKTILAESGDLATYRGYQKAGTEEAVVISCVGEQIATSGEYNTLSINLPKSVYTGIDYSFPNGLLQMDMTLEPHYDSGITSALAIACTTVDAAYLTAAS
jgi:hypothetical protein